MKRFIAIGVCMIMSFMLFTGCVNPQPTAETTEQETVEKTEGTEEESETTKPTGNPDPDMCLEFPTDEDGHVVSDTPESLNEFFEEYDETGNPGTEDSHYESNSHYGSKTNPDTTWERTEHGLEVK